MSQKIKVEQIADLTAIDNVVEDTTPELGGDLQSNGNDIVFADNDKATFGSATGGDLQIYHNGSNSYIDDAGTGILYIRSSDVRLGKYTGENMLRGLADGAVTLYHNNNDKLATTSTGVTVTGTLAATAVTGDGSGLTNLPSGGNADTLDGLDSSQFLRSDTADTKTSGNLSFSDNIKARFGNGADLQIYHDGSDSFIKDGGTGNLHIDATQLNFRNGTQNATYADFTDGGAAQLYHNNAVKFATTATGVTVTGTIAATAVTGDGSGLTNLPAAGISNVVEDTTPQLGGDLQSNGNDIDFADNDKAIFGAGNDLQIYHDGSNSYISDTGTGHLKVTAASLLVQNTSGDNRIFADQAGPVNLYHGTSGSPKLATSATGVTVTGTLAATAFTGDGSGLTGITASGSGSAKAWCQFDGTAATISYGESFNGSGLTDLGEGRYQNNITNSMNTTTYPVIAEAGNELSDYPTQSNDRDHNSLIGSRTSSAQRLYSVDHNTGVQDDCQSMNAVIFGDLA